ncbi:MAG TPA: arginine N-succinyltransferase [Chromatiaceae bacterium]|nr:arginine N-succinyltransferase [Chromatiaceae bacterium]
MTNTETPTNRGLRASSVAWIVLATILITAGATYWVVRSYIYAKDFKPVELSAQEQRRLDGKLRLLGYQPDDSGRRRTGEPSPDEFDAEGRLKPEKYSEAGAKREVEFSERELNGLLASNPEMARRLAVDLSRDTISARLLVPVDRDFPIFGGKTLRVSAGVEAAFHNGRPRIVLKGVSVAGVPIPNAWLGGLKNIDLISEFGDQQGFWKSFAEGVEDIQVEDGHLKVKLKE